MPQGKGTYGSQIGRPSKKSPDTPMYKMKGNPMQRNFPGWWKQSKLKKDLGTARDIIVKDIKTGEEKLKGVGSKFVKDIKGLASKLGIKKQSPKKHKGTHPFTAPIPSHKGHNISEKIPKLHRGPGK